MQTVWIINWQHEDGESGSWAAASYEAAVKSITENETVSAEDLEPGEDGTLDVEWTVQYGIFYAESADTGMHYRFEEMSVEGSDA